MQQCHPDTNSDHIGYAAVADKPAPTKTTSSPLSSASRKPGGDGPSSMVSPDSL